MQEILKEGTVLTNEDGVEATVLGNGNLEIDGEEVEVVTTPEGFTTEEETEVTTEEETEVTTEEETEVTTEDAYIANPPVELLTTDTEPVLMTHAIAGEITDAELETIAQESRVEKAHSDETPEGYVHPSLRNETYAGPAETE